LTNRLLRRSELNITIFLSLSSTAVGFQLNVLIPIIPTLQNEFRTSIAQTNWVLISCLLAAGSSLPIVGRCGDILDKLVVFRTLIVLGAAGSIISLLSTGLYLLIIGRVLQGISLGVVSLGMSLVQDMFRVKRRAKSITIIGSCFGLGGSLSLPLGAYISSEFSWRAVFWIPIIMLSLAFINLPHRSGETKHNRQGINFASAFMLASGLTLFIYSIFTFSSTESNQVFRYGTLVCSLLILAYWVRHEKQSEEPLIDLKSLLERDLFSCNFASFGISAAMFTYSILLPQIFLGRARLAPESVTELEVAFTLMPTGILMFFISPIIGNLIKTRGPKEIFEVGLVFVLIGFAGSTFLIVDLIFFLIVSTILGIGYALTYSSMTILAMSLSPKDKSGEASGMNALVQTLGASIGGALISSFLSVNGESDGLLSDESVFRMCLVFAILVVLFSLLVLSRIKRDHNLENEILIS